MHHIRDTLPEIKSKISGLIAQAQQVLTEYGAGMSDSKINQGALVLQLITEFSNNYVEAIDGQAATLSTQDLYADRSLPRSLSKKKIR